MHVFTTATTLPNWLDARGERDRCHENSPIFSKNETQIFENEKSPPPYADPVGQGGKKKKRGKEKKSNQNKKIKSLCVCLSTCQLRGGATEKQSFQHLKILEGSRFSFIWRHRSNERSTDL